MINKMLLTFLPISHILLSEQGDYSVVEKAEPDPLNLLANTDVGSKNSDLSLLRFPILIEGAFFIQSNKITMFAREL